MGGCLRGLRGPGWPRAQLPPAAQVSSPGLRFWPRSQPSIWGHFLPNPSVKDGPIGATTYILDISKLEGPSAPFQSPAPSFHR